MQHRAAPCVVPHLDFCAVHRGQLVTAFDGGFLGAPEAAERRARIPLAQAPFDLSTREVSQIERFGPRISRWQDFGALDVQANSQCAGETFCIACRLLFGGSGSGIQQNRPRSFRRLSGVVHRLTVPSAACPIKRFPEVRGISFCWDKATQASWIPGGISPPEANGPAGATPGSLAGEDAYATLSVAHFH